MELPTFHCLIFESTWEGLTLGPALSALQHTRKKLVMGDQVKLLACRPMRRGVLCSTQMLFSKPCIAAGCIAAGTLQFLRFCSMIAVLCSTAVPPDRWKSVFFRKKSQCAWPFLHDPVKTSCTVCKTFVTQSVLLRSKFCKNWMLFWHSYFYWNCALVVRPHPPLIVITVK